MVDIDLGDGFTTASVDGPLDPSLPLVVLLHGLGGSALDMTDPQTAWSGVAFDRTATFPIYEDAGLALMPPLLPVTDFFLDPPLTGLTSWRQALLRAGFSTVSYTQSGATITPNVAQLTALATGPLTTNPAYAKMRIAFVAHSRGGLVARAFLVSAAATPALAPFLARVTSLVTLHTPHLGSGLANAANTVDALLARTIAALTSMGITPPALLTLLRGTTASPSVTELGVGSLTIAGIAAREPVPGITYHTFGGTSTQFARLWAKVFTPDSAIPIPVPLLPIPLFHHGKTNVPIGVPLDRVSFAPVLIVAQVPIVAELTAALALFVASTPELAHGSGDGLVTDARAHLLFSATRTTNPLNHAEALWDPTLQAQVVAILSRLRTPAFPGRLSPGSPRSRRQ